MSAPQFTPDYAKEAQVLRQTLEAIFRGVWVGESAVDDIQIFARNGLRCAAKARGESDQ
jgi:hypothetical protein